MAPKLEGNGLGRDPLVSEADLVSHEDASVAAALHVARSVGALVVLTGTSALARLLLSTGQHSAESGGCLVEVGVSVGAAGATEWIAGEASQMGASVDDERLRLVLGAD